MTLLITLIPLTFALSLLPLSSSSPDWDFFCEWLQRAWHLVDTGIRAFKVAHADHVEKTAGDQSSSAFLFSWLGRAILVHELLRWLRGSLLLALLQLAGVLGAFLLSLWLVPLGFRALRLAYMRRSRQVDSMFRSAAEVVVPRQDSKVGYH